MGLATPCAQLLSRTMRELGACWCSQRRMWVLELGYMRDVLAGLAERQAWWQGLSLGCARKTALAAWRQPCPDYSTARLDVRRMPLQGGGYVVSSGYG